MRLFISSLQNNTPTTPPVGVEIPALSNFAEPITIGVDTTLSTMWWVDVKKATDWPNITGLTKDYFVLYGADHGVSDCYWGEMDSPDFTGFIERGAMGLKQGTSSARETPRLYKDPETNTYLLAYHNKTSIGQETQFFRASGSCSLSNVETSGDWTFYNSPMGTYPNDASSLEGHTGYFTTLSDLVGNIYKNTDGYYEAHHVGNGSDTGLLDSSELKRSLSLDLQTWWRSDLIKHSTDFDIHPNIVVPHEFGVIKQIQGVNVLFNWYRNVVDGEFDGLTSNFGVFLLDENYLRPRLIKSDSFPNPTKEMDFAVFGNTLYVYATSLDEIGNSKRRYVATLDLSNADQWDGITSYAVDYPDRVDFIAIEPYPPLTTRKQFVFDVGNLGDATDLDDLQIGIYRMSLNANCFTSPVINIGSINNPLTTSNVSRVGNRFTIGNLSLPNFTETYGWENEYWIIVENNSGKLSMGGNHIKKPFL